MTIDDVPEEKERRERRKRKDKEKESIIPSLINGSEIEEFLISGKTSIFQWLWKKKEGKRVQDYKIPK